MKTPLGAPFNKYNKGTYKILQTLNTNFSKYIRAWVLLLHMTNNISINDTFVSAYTHNVIVCFVLLAVMRELIITCQRM